MKKSYGAGLLVLAGALALAGCNTAGNSTVQSAGPSLNTGNSAAGLELANTVGGAAVNGYIAFNGAASLGIASGGNPDGLQSFGLDPNTGYITFLPVAGQTPGIYPIYINASDSSGNLTQEEFLAYVYGSSNPTSVTQNSSSPPVVDYSTSSLSGSIGSATGTVSLGLHNGFLDATQQTISASVVAANGISITGVYVVQTATTDVYNVQASFRVNSSPVNGGGASTCPNGNLILLTAKPFHDNGQNPSLYQEYVCLNLT